MTTQNGTTKRCPHCEEHLPLDAFTTSPTGKYGRYTYCRRCSNARRRDYKNRAIARGRAAKSDRAMQIDDLPRVTSWGELLDVLQWMSAEDVRHVWISAIADRLIEEGGDVRPLVDILLIVKAAYETQENAG